MGNVVEANFNKIAVAAANADTETLVEDQVIADLYNMPSETLGSVARAKGITRTRVMLALYRLNLLPGQ